MTSDTYASSSRPFGCDPTDRLVGETEASRLLGVKPSTLRKWRWSGRGPIRFIRVGRSVRYALCDIRAFVETGRRNSTSEAGDAA